MDRSIHTSKKHMKWHLRNLVSVTLCICSVLAFSRPAAAACGWHVVPSPHFNNNAILNSVAAASASNVWAVGYYSNGSFEQPLAEHWNGIRWAIVASPTIHNATAELHGIAAISASNVWAVGSYSNGSNYHTLTEHWNGTSWSVVPSPNAHNGDDYLLSVAAVSASNVWAVGLDRNQTLTEHWDGSRWLVVPSRNANNDYNNLTSVAAVSASNVWAVGGYENPFPQTATLTEQWNGSRWSVVLSPNVNNNMNFLSSVAAVCASDIWAVGSSNDSGLFAQTLTEHWNGRRWTVVPSPNDYSGTGSLSSVAAVSASSLWAVGFSVNPALSVSQTLTEHWDGSRWTVVPSPNGNNELYSLAAVSASNVWAVGKYFNGSHDQTLIEWFHC